MTIQLCYGEYGSRSCNHHEWKQYSTNRVCVQIIHYKAWNIWIDIGSILITIESVAKFFDVVLLSIFNNCNMGIVKSKVGQFKEHPFPPTSRKILIYSCELFKTACTYLLGLIVEHCILATQILGWVFERLLCHDDQSSMCYWKKFSWYNFYKL